MWSGPMRCVAGPSSSTPSISSAFVPMPWILAPIAFSAWQRPWTCGSQAALRSRVFPRASTAAMTAFSVAVTLASSRKTSAPLKRPGRISR